MSYDEKVCNERHERIDARQRETETKVDGLIKSDASNTTEIKNLCQQMASLTKAIWGLVTSMALTLVGFFIWTIQSGIVGKVIK